ncbi:MAG: hypothetical protein GTO02_12870, partial [Candidatus Dadabacteria bacterium]|nr:hypothetical protein [Candidatus Dadabacteria bacterium]
MNRVLSLLNYELYREQYAAEENAKNGIPAPSEDLNLIAELEHAIEIIEEHEWKEPFAESKPEEH